MLKQFLKFFRNSDDPSEQLEHPHLSALSLPENQGKTYVEFLFEKVRPRVQRRLDEFPDSDPLLEVATGILLEIFPDYWEEPVGALVDDWSPQAQAPPPPPPAASDSPIPPAPPVNDEDSEESVDEAEEEGEDLDVVEAEEVEEAIDESGEEEEEAEKEEEAGEEGGDEEEIADEIVEEEIVAEEIQEIDDLGATEEATVDAEPPAGFVSAMDDTVEFEPPPIMRSEEKKGSIWPRTLEEPSVLHGARVLLAVLLDNDRLPPSEQLETTEVLLAAELWIHLVAQATSLDDRVQRLARLVEQKFGANHFSQARLLLQIFPANRETRLNNDRQLFYEDMILRLGIRRRTPLASDDLEGLAGELGELSLDDDDSARETLARLGREAGLKLHAYTRRPEEVDSWRQLAERSSRPGAPSYLLGLMPPRRWREVSDQTGRTVRTILREHIVRPMVRDHVIGHIRTCYFVLRAVGDTGLEPYLDCFFDWSKERWDIDGTTFLPEIHNGVAGGLDMIGDIFESVYGYYYRDAVEEVLDEIDDAALDKAFAKAMANLAEADLREVAAGNFDLGGFVLDAALGFEYHTPGFAFRMHRLT